MRFCGRCGRPHSQHVRIIKGAPRVCPLEFSIVNSSGKRREADYTTLPLGVQRTKQNQAAWVNPARLT